jgi:hypothetical protein
MRREIITAAMACALVVLCPNIGRADAVTDCAKAQGKAYAANFASIVIEAGRACGKGSTGAPAAVSEGAIGKAAGKFFAVIGKSVDEFGPTSCALTLGSLNDQGVGADLESQLNTAINAANIACLVPKE